MPITYSIDEKSTTEKDRQVFGEALKTLYGSALYNDFLSDLDVDLKLKDLGAGTKGEHDLKSGQVSISPGSGRYQNTPNELLNVILHELTHAAQKKAREQGTAYSSRTNTQIVNSQTSGTLSTDALIGFMKEANMDYGYGEPAAYLGANMRPGPQAKDPEIMKFIGANPAFSREYYRRNAQPQRPVGTHYKAEPEWTVLEKMINSVTGIQPTVD